MENITPKEWLISIVVFLLALAVLVFFQPFLKDGLIDEVAKYEQAVKIENNPTEFVYAHQTNVGNVLAHGNMVSIEPQSIPELKEKYGMIVKIKEHYTMHTRQVCASTDKKGNCTSYRTETYYTWDYDGRESFLSKSYDFLGVKFQLDQLDLEANYNLALDQGTVNAEYLPYCEYNYMYTELGWFGGPGGDDRYYYRVLPINFTAAMFVKFIDGKILDPFHPTYRVHVYLDFGINDIVEEQKSKLVTFDVIYYLVGLTLLLGGYFFWAYSTVEIR